MNVNAETKALETKTEKVFSTPADTPQWQAAHAAFESELNTLRKNPTLAKAVFSEFGKEASLNYSLPTLEVVADKSGAAQAILLAPGPHEAGNHTVLSESLTAVGMQMLQDNNQAIIKDFVHSVRVKNSKASGAASQMA